MRVAAEKLAFSLLSTRCTEHSPAPVRRATCHACLRDKLCALDQKARSPEEAIPGIVEATQNGYSFDREQLARLWEVGKVARVHLAVGLLFELVWLARRARAQRGGGQ